MQEVCGGDGSQTPSAAAMRLDMPPLGLGDPTSNWRVDARELGVWEIESLRWVHYMPLLIFVMVLLSLFAIELMGPIQTHVIQPLTGLIAQTSAILLQTFDSSVQAQGIVLRDTATGVAVSIQPGCNGVEALICVIAAIVATPASWKYRMIGIGLGFLAIQSLNLARIISLFYLLQWNPVWFEWAHLYLWQALIMLDGLVVYLFWVRMLPLELPAPGQPTSAETPS